MKRFVKYGLDGRLRENVVDDEGITEPKRLNDGTAYSLREVSGHNPASADCQCDFCTHKLTRHIKDDCWDFLVIDEQGTKRDVRDKYQALPAKPKKRVKHKALNIKVEVMEDDD